MYLGTFTGTLAGWSVGEAPTIRRINIEGEFPKSSPGEQAAARAHRADFVYPYLGGYDGDQVTFELWRIHGDLVAKKITKVTPPQSAAVRETAAIAPGAPARTYETR